MRKYCFSCGAKLEFSPRDQPKFCSRCGKPLVAGTSEAGETKRNLSEEQEDNEQVIVPRSITGLEVEINEIETGKETLGSLIGTLEKSEVNKFPRNIQKVSSEEAMKQFKKEAGSIKPSKAKKDAQ